jgi:hypothetical protein
MRHNFFKYNKINIFKELEDLKGFTTLCKKKLKNIMRKFPTCEDKCCIFFSQKYFGKLKMDIYKCPNLKYRNIS